VSHRPIAPPAGTDTNGTRGSGLLAGSAEEIQWVDAKPRTCRASDRGLCRAFGRRAWDYPGRSTCAAELHRHGPTQIATLHCEFGHKRSTLTSILDRLERRKFRRRELNSDDRRSFVIHLTASGTRAASRVTDALDELERYLRRALDSNELRRLQTVTEAIEAAIRDHAASSHVALWLFVGP
jgi:DNA-binding MarR family transcriptional regulator